VSARATAEPRLRDLVDQAFADARGILASPGPRGARDALAPARAKLAEHEARWNSRMRVALAGRVSAGKSTLVNALLGEERAATGGQEVTKVVTWLRYAPEPALTVYYKDAGRQPLPVIPPTLAALRELSTHGSEPEPEFLHDADFVVYDHPNDRLKAFDLIDTPGWDDARGIDMANTKRHLGPREDTADALIAVITIRGISTEDTDLLRHFQRIAQAGHAEVGPLTTMGVLTKAELLWEPGQPLLADGQLAVLKHAQEEARKHMSGTEVRRLLYQLHPVATKIAAAAGSSLEADFPDLTELARIEPASLRDRLSKPRRWVTGDIPGVPVSAERRGALFERFTACGIALACQLIRDGASSPVAARERLIELSGLASFRRTLAEHFGERGDLIRAARLIERTSSLEAEERIALAARPRDALYRASGKVSALAHTPAFAEREVLRAHYGGRLRLDEAETKEMLRVFGESPGGRLPEELAGTAPGQLAAYAAQRSTHWRRQADLGDYHGETRNACHAISRTYDHLSAQLSALG
jgi:hypothetical protein